MSQLTLENNEFLRQFEVVVNGSMARIEYAEQERKFFLTKLIVPEDLNTTEFKDEFIKTVLDSVAEKNMRVGFLERITLQLRLKRKLFRNYVPKELKNLIYLVMNFCLMLSNGKTSTEELFSSN